MNLEAYSTDDLLILQEYLAWLQRYRVDVQKGLQCISKTLERKHRERIFIVAGLLSLLENNGTGDGDLAEAVQHGSTSLSTWFRATSGWRCRNCSDAS